MHQQYIGPSKVYHDVVQDMTHFEVANNVSHMVEAIDTLGEQTW